MVRMFSIYWFSVIVMRNIEGVDHLKCGFFYVLFVDRQLTKTEHAAEFLEWL